MSDPDSERVACSDPECCGQRIAIGDAVARADLDSSSNAYPERCTDWYPCSDCYPVRDPDRHA